MATYQPDQHGYSDSELIKAKELAAIIGVSAVAISKAVNGAAGRLDIYLNSLGKVRFHPVESPRQWVGRRVNGAVQSPNQAQKAAGMGGLQVQATAHLGVTNPLRTESTRKPPPDDGKTIEERAVQELAQSRADRERFNARILELRVREKEGELVDKAVFYQQAHAMMAAVKDQLNGLPPQISPGIVSHLEECMTSFGLSEEQAREIIVKGAVSHMVREAIRQGITRALRDITSRPVQELLHA